MAVARLGAGFAARILASLLLVMVVAAASRPVQPAGEEGLPSPLLWKVEHGSSTLYLFGTFHLLKPDTRWLNPAVASALDSADELVLEISEEQADANLVAFIIRNKGMYRSARGLQKTLSEETWLELVEQAAAVGIPEQAIGRFRPWYAAIALSIQYAQAQGFLSEYGAEATLTARAKAAGKPVLGLETAYEQLSTLADHPKRIQVLMLENTLQELEDLPRILNDMTEAWVTGDEDAIAALIVSGAREIPELFEAVIVRRNRNWMPALEERLDRPGVYFVAVGVAHLVGDDSVVALLRSNGYSVELQK